MYIYIYIYTHTRTHTHTNTHAHTHMQVDVFVSETNNGVLDLADFTAVLCVGPERCVNA